MSQKGIVVLADCPDQYGVPLSDEPHQAMKMLHGNGYERFEFSGEYAEVNGQEIPVYRWRYRTAIAE
jgi:hypothetical protein